MKAHGQVRPDWGGGEARRSGWSRAVGALLGGRGGGRVIL